MLDLHALCGDLKDARSPLRKEIDGGAEAALALLRRPSEQTAALTAGWLEDFRKIYGDPAAGLSGNSRLARLAADCGGTAKILIREDRFCVTILMGCRN